MEANELREKLTEYIKVADDKKVAALYTLLDNEIESEYKWYEDEAFIAELKDREERMYSGTEKSYSLKEATVYLKEKKAQIMADAV